MIIASAFPLIALWFFSALLKTNGVALPTPSSHDVQWSGYKSVGYFANWAIYDPQGYFVTNMTAKDFTHVLYAFAAVDLNGTVYLSDDYADLQFEYPGDNEDEAGNNMYGNLKQLFLLKEHNRNLKVILSIGGGSASDSFANINSTLFRETFANTSATLLSDAGFDGLDVDFADQANATADLFRLMRQQLDIAAKKNGASHYTLSWAASCGTYYWFNIDVPAMDKYIDMWNLMAYDFSGEWTYLALPASNLYSDGNPANYVGASGSQCAEYYSSQGVDKRKLTLGMPLYGTAFNGTQGMYSTWTDLGGGDWGEDGNYDIKHLPLTGETVFYNKTLGASWSYNNLTGHITSFDTPTVALQKAQYVMSERLGGMFFWEMDGDFSLPQSQSHPSGPTRPGHWNPAKGEQKRKSFGRGKGLPWPLSSGSRSELGLIRRDNRDLQSKKATTTITTLGLEISFNSAAGWEKLMDSTNSICLNIGESLVDTVVTAFEKWGNGLDQTKNSLSYPHSSYDNLRDGFRRN